MRRNVLALVAAMAGTVGAVAWAQQAQTPKVLHEDLPSPGSGGERSPLVGDQPAAGKNPEAFASGDKVLPEPEMAPKESGEPVFGGHSFSTDRQTEQRPDTNTGSDGTLHYVSVFNPDVMPFKRMSSFDGVADDYTAIVRSNELTTLPVGGATDKDRDRFWASLMVQLSPGKDVAIPSVAPDMRILSYETQPAISVTFSKDPADNFYVRAEGGVAGQYRLVFLADANSGYFAPALPPHAYTVARVRERAMREGLLPVLPPGVLTMAKKAIADRGLHEGDDLGEAFNKLVYYFRGFEAKSIVNPTGDTFWDLYKNQAGVCRHRSSTFMITANALGIPTRLVTNEAHAFVEVWFPERGWQRIDLGGAALRLDVQNGADKTIHRPRAEDPFAKPQQYSKGYTHLEGDIKGLSQSQLDEAHKSAEDGPSSGDFSNVFGDGSGNGSGDGSGDGSDDILGPNQDPRGHQNDPSKITPVVQITAAGDTGYRGELLRVDGRVDALQAPVPGVRVDVMLRRSYAFAGDLIQIGRGVTASDGTFSIDAVLPPDLDLTSYDIFASTREDLRFNAGISQ